MGSSVFIIPRINPSNVPLVFKEQFTGNGALTTFTLTGAILNATFAIGSWDKSNLILWDLGDVTKTTGKALYDSAIPFVRNRISISNIDANGVVTLDHPPQAENFNIYYWYQPRESDRLSSYVRDDVISKVEESEPEIAGAIQVDTTNFNKNLGVGDDTVQKALDTLDDMEGGEGGEEEDPIFTGSVAYGIDAEDVSNWNTAFGWGNHAGLYSLLGHDHDDVYEPIGEAAAERADHENDFNHGLLHAPVSLASSAAVLLDLSTQELSLDNQNANLVLAGPASGEAVAPAFRSLINDDLPIVSVTKGGTGVIKCPAFHVYKNAEQTGIAPSTPTLLTWPVEVYDTDNYFASNRFTPLVAGKYLCIGVVITDGTSPTPVGQVVRVEIWKSGVRLITGPYTIVPVTTNLSAFVTGFVDCNGTTDYIEMYVYHGFTGNATILGIYDLSWFQGIWVGP